MESKFRFVRERVKQVVLVGRTWRLVSIVRERIVTGRELRRREQFEREAKRRAEREIRARVIKTF